MCWNWEVSIAFAVGLAASSLFIFQRRRFNFKGSHRDPYEALIVLNLAFVQFYEFLIWLTVYPSEDNLNLCPKANTVFTAMVYFHGVVFWPPIVNTFAFKTTSGIKEYFAFPLLYGCLYTILGIADLLYSQFNIADQYTCGIDGKVFLRWNVALSQSRILPNGFDWFLFTAFPFVFYKPRPLGFFMAFYLILTFAIPYLLVTLGEAASIFCWLGVGIFLSFLFEPYISFYMTQKYPSVVEFDPFQKLHDRFIKAKPNRDSTRLRSPITSTSEVEMDTRIKIVVDQNDKTQKDQENNHSSDDEDADQLTESTEARSFMETSVETPAP